MGKREENQTRGIFILRKKKNKQAPTTTQREIVLFCCRERICVAGIHSKTVSLFFFLRSQKFVLFFFFSGTYLFVSQSLCLGGCCLLVPSPPAVTKHVVKHTIKGAKKKKKNGRQSRYQFVRFFSNSAQGRGAQTLKTSERKQEPGKH